jgi:hypothetical protein
MDIYEFLNSKDVAAYCRKISKTWNTYQKAVIISMSERPLEDKRAAFQHLLDNEPDASAHLEVDGEIFYSTHKIIAAILTWDWDKDWRISNAKRIDGYYDISGRIRNVFPKYDIIPTPEFKRGDIITTTETRNSWYDDKTSTDVFVLDSFESHDKYQTNRDYQGFFVDEIGVLCSMSICADKTYYEHYRSDSTDEDRILIALSNYIREEPQLSEILFRGLHCYDEYYGSYAPPKFTEDERSLITKDSILKAYNIHRRVDMLLNDFEEHIKNCEVTAKEIIGIENRALPSVERGGIYYFIPSYDIIAHCRSIGHKFTALEQAIIVYYSNKLFTEKCATWQKIIDTLPDEAIPEDDCYWGETCYDSLHKLLQDYMSFKNGLVEKMKSDEPGATYIYWRNYQKSKPYNSFNEVIAAFKADYNTEPYKDQYTVYKLYEGDDSWLYDEGFSTQITINGEIIDICENNYDGCSNEDCCRRFFELDMCFPHPFKKGDILTHGTSAVVTESDDNSPDSKIHSVRNVGNINCYRIKAGKVARKREKISWYQEYFRSELKGKERILPAIGSHLKGELSAEQLLNSYAEILSRNN